MQKHASAFKGWLIKTSPPKAKMPNPKCSQQQIEIVMNTSFALINNLANFLEPLDAEWFISGGWAIDLYLDRITRQRCDLDISVPVSRRLECIEFFLEKGWQIEGKLFGGFKTLWKLSDYTEDIYYFWSFPKEADFISEYLDGKGNRRIAYNREFQSELDYMEVFFDEVEDTYFVYRGEPRVKRHVAQAILEGKRVKYLAPELVLLYKSNRLSEKNLQDFGSVIGSLNEEQKSWLKKALLLVYGGNSHAWLEQL